MALNIEKKVEELVKPIIEGLGYELYDVEYAKEGKEYYLRIFIDKETGISIDDCENVNNSINDILDQADYIKEQYFLEVSSPGIERILRKDKHLEANIGVLVEIKMFKAIDGQKVLQGILKEFSKDNIVLELEDKYLEISRKDISVIKTVYEW